MVWFVEEFGDVRLRLGTTSTGLESGLVPLGLKQEASSDLLDESYECGPPLKPFPPHLLAYFLLEND